MTRKFTGNRCLAALIVTPIVLVLATGFVLFRPPMPPSLIRQLKPGMTQAEVRKIMGDPHKTEDEDGLWYYSRWGNLGWLGLGFDHQGRLQMIDDEPVFR